MQTVFVLEGACICRRLLPASLPSWPGTIGLSIVFTWMFNSTGASVLLCTALHQAINSATDVLGPSIPLVDQVTFQWLFNTLHVLAAMILVVWSGPARLSRAPAFAVPTLRQRACWWTSP